MHSTMSVPRVLVKTGEFPADTSNKMHLKTLDGCSWPFEGYSIATKSVTSFEESKVENIGTLKGFAKQ